MENIGKITIDPTLDLGAIAETAGQHDPALRWYKDGVLYVKNVTDEVLSEVAACINTPKMVSLRCVEARKTELASIRWQHQTSGIVVDDVSLRTDRDSLIDLREIADRSSGEFPLSYKATTGFVKLATKEQATKYANAQKAHIQACFEHEATLTAKITSLKDNAEALAALDLEKGWPK